MSRSELATAIAEYIFRQHQLVVSIDGEHIGKYERGEHRWPTARYREAFRIVLGVRTDADIGFYPARRSGGHQVGSILETTPAFLSGSDLDDEVEDGLWLSTDTAELISRFTREDLAMDRRDASRTLAGLIFGGALLEPLERWLLSPVPATSRLGAKKGFGVQEVEEVESATQLLRSWDDRFGRGLRRKAVIGQLSEVADLVHDAPPGPLTARLYAAMAQLAGTVAGISWDSGQHRLAQQYYGLALRSAQQANDRAFGANVLAGMARQLLYLDHVSDALELIKIAQHWSTGKVTSKVKAMLHTREAWSYARQGRVTAFRQATALAEAELGSSAEGEEHPYWIGYFDQAELAGVTGGRLLELTHRQPAGASRKTLAAETADYIDQAIRQRRGRRVRSVALDRIGVAEARLLQGELEEACRLGHAAAEVSEHTPSDRVKIKLREFYACTRPHSSVPVVNELRQRIIGILRAPVAA